MENGSKMVAKTFGIFGECLQLFKWKNILLSLEYISIFLDLHAHTVIIYLLFMEHLLCLSHYAWEDGIVALLFIVHSG